MSDAFDTLTDVLPPVPGPGRTPGRIGMSILMILWAGLAVLCFVSAVPGWRLATGAVGVPGTLTVLSCEDLGEGRYDCKGRFTPDGGGTAIAVDASPDSDAGDVTRARLAPEGDRAVPTGTTGVLAALTMPFLGVGVPAFLPYVLLHVFGVRRGRRGAVIAGSVLTCVSLTGVLVGLVAASL
ncbi:hypothetical protein [Streptosporangium longisporum]|uniref:DUF4190 domain-containing protein n=1 Tax=Streptosporangium longisporum TaxID=46187 RepID=A0ABP6L7K2_9ACTN